MKCKDCLIWQKKREELVYKNTEYWDDCVHYGGKKLLRSLISLVPLNRKEFYGHEFLRDEECPQGRCLLCEA